MISNFELFNRNHTQFYHLRKKEDCMIGAWQGLRIQIDMYGHLRWTSRRPQKGHHRHRYIWTYPSAFDLKIARYVYMCTYLAFDFKIAISYEQSL